MAIQDQADEAEASNENWYNTNANQHLIDDISGENAMAYLQEQIARHKFIAPRMKYAVSDQEQGSIFTIDSFHFDLDLNSNVLDLDLETAEEVHLGGKIFSLQTTKNDRYDERIFHGVLIDIGAAGWSTVGVGQVRALQQIQKEFKVDKTRAGEVKISGIGNGIYLFLLALLPLVRPLAKLLFIFYLATHLSYLAYKI